MWRPLSVTSPTDESILESLPVIATIEYYWNHCSSLVMVLRRPGAAQNFLSTTVTSLERVSTQVVVVVVRELFSFVASAICVRIRLTGQRLRRLFTTWLKFFVYCRVLTTLLFLFFCLSRFVILQNNPVKLRIVKNKIYISDTYRSHTTLPFTENGVQATAETTIKRNSSTLYYNRLCLFLQHKPPACLEPTPTT